MAALQGTPGATGPAGAVGPMGAPGVMGTAGERGPEGPAGVEGAEGAVGPAGPMGEIGPAGPEGAPGRTGLGVMGLSLERSAGGESITVRCGDQDCAPDHPGWVVMPGLVPGSIVTLPVTANHVLGRDHLLLPLFATAANRPWPLDRPFFLYALNANDQPDGLFFALSPCPTHAAAPGDEGRLGFRGAPPAIEDDLDVIVFADPTPELAGKPMLRIGSVRMTRGLNGWFVSPFDMITDPAGTLVASPRGAIDGLDRYANEHQLFYMPRGQMGATEASYFGNFFFFATIPAAEVRYVLRLDGTVLFSGALQVDSAGGTTAYLYLPYRTSTTFLPRWSGTGRLDSAGGLRALRVDSSDAAIQFAKVTSTSTLAEYLTGNELGETNLLEFQLTYKAF